MDDRQTSLGGWEWPIDEWSRPRFIVPILSGVTSICAIYADF